MLMQGDRAHTLRCAEKNFPAPRASARPHRASGENLFQRVKRKALRNPPRFKQRGIIDIEATGAGKCMVDTDIAAFKAVNILASFICPSPFSWAFFVPRDSNKR
jgi:hypothetical protein